MRTKLSQIELKGAYQYLIEHSRFDIDLIVLISLSTVICFLGFYMDSAAVIIGAMVVSPLLYPLVAIPAAVFEKDKSSFLRRLLILAFSVVLVILLSFLMNLLVPVDLAGNEIAERLEDSTLVYFLVALFSGMAGTFCFYWPKVIEAVTGVAISIALLPPLCILGISFATAGTVWSTAAIISGMNLFGILGGAILVLAVLYLIKLPKKKN